MTSSNIPTDPLSTLTLNVFRLHGLLLRNGDRITRSIGQSSARWQVLGRVGYTPQTVAQIARDMGHARQSVQRIANVLEEEGLVAYRDNPNDKRACLLELTPQGEKVLGEIYARNDTWTNDIMRKLDATKLQEIADEINTISDVIEEDERVTTKEVT